MCCVTGRTEKERFGVLRVGSMGGEGRMKTQERERDLVRHISQAEGRHERLV